jgi:hypothetical protein
MQEKEHPAAPEQIEHGFDEGVGRRPRPDAQRRVGRFSDGIAARTREELRRRRFSEGIERFPESRPNDVEGSFDRGYERISDGSG